MARVGIIALIQESNTFLPGKTTVQHFQQDILLTGEDVRQHFAHAHHEVRGFFDGLAMEGMEAVPIFAARAYPFGTIEANAFDTLVQMMVVELKKAGKLDGILVAPHGATVAENHPDADGYWLGVLRNQVGPRTPIIGTLDPHGNLSEAMVQATHALISYQTNPHMDQQARGEQAAKLIARTIRGEVQPTQSMCMLPMAINIERQCTSEQPLLDLLQEFEQVRKQPEVLTASLMLGFPYADVAEMGSSVLVVTNNQPALARKIAYELGEVIWNSRASLAGDFISANEAVKRANALAKPVCLLDMGDNVGGGSPADGTLLTHELLDQKVGPSFVCIYDPQSVLKAQDVGVGKVDSFEVGGKTDHMHGQPVCNRFQVLWVGDGKFSEDQVRHGGFTHFDQGQTAILRTEDGLLTLMITSRRVPPFSLRQLTAFGLDPKAFAVLVAKGVNAPIAAYAPVCPSMVRVNTMGVTVADMTMLPYKNRRKPMFPFEKNTMLGAKP